VRIFEPINTATAARPASAAASSSSGEEEEMTGPGGGGYALSQRGLPLLLGAGTAAAGRGGGECFPRVD
jgi:hypothetical protein